MWGVCIARVIEFGEYIYIYISICIYVYMFVCLYIHVHIHVKKICNSHSEFVLLNKLTCSFVTSTLVILSIYVAAVCLRPPCRW